MEEGNVLNQEKKKSGILFQKVQGAMRSLPDFAETCKAILDVVIDQMDAENCSLMLRDPVSGELIIRAAHGKDGKRSVYYTGHNGRGDGKRFKAGEGIAGLVLEKGQALMLDDVRNEPRFVCLDGLNTRVGSLICIPVCENDRIVGVFNLSHSKKGAFDEGDKLALAYVANQVGAALTSARFFLEIQEMNRLTKDSEKTSPKKKSASASTFIEVGEMTREDGIFIYTSKRMHRIKEIIDQVANTDVTVLVQGESGVGKEVVARSIHLNSSRRDRPFVKVNCAALPEELLESELFGYEKGAFTGAYHQKPGKFELAHGGTIFLDEIIEMSTPLQAKLLQVLQDGEFSRLGGKKDVRVDVRVIAATNKNIVESVQNGQFREDLYYRLNVVNITIPPLRERREEIPILAEYFLDKYGKKFNKTVKSLDDQMVTFLLEHHWSGNVRELENVIQRYVVLGDGETIIRELTPDVPRETLKEKGKSSSSRKDWPSLKKIHQEAIMKAESEVIHRALNMTNWNRKKAAKLLNVSYKALLYKIEGYGIHKRSTSLPQKQETVAKGSSGQGFE
jgi:two-component system, NtrC family, response regulator AtoC